MGMSGCREGEARGWGTVGTLQSERGMPSYPLSPGTGSIPVLAPSPELKLA